jgi:hypothetical protein
MRDLKSFYVRANTCVACHQNLDSDFAAAGHPELVFELDGQSMREPKHWTDDPGTGARAWLVGQAVALRETSWRLSLNPNADAQTHQTWQALVWLLGAVTSSERTLLPIDGTAAHRDDKPYAIIQQQADGLARRAAQQNIGREAAARLLRSLAAMDSAFMQTNGPTDVLFRKAQRLVLALERLDIATRPPIASAAPAAQEVALLREGLESGGFDPVQFAGRLRAFRDTLDR